MNRLIHGIVRCCIKQHEDINDPVVRARYGALEAWVGIVVNTLLCGTKLVLGIAIKSVALVGDGINQLGDVVVSIIILAGFRIAGKERDAEHPFGHGRMESVAGLIVGVLIAVAAVELLRSSIERIVHPAVAAERLGGIILVVLAAACGVKLLMAIFARQLGRMIASKTLEADAWNHLFDVGATLMVIASLIATRYGYHRVDGVGGVAVAVIILFTAYGVIREAIGPLLGEAPSAETLERIETIACGTEGVLNVHDIIVHRYGQLYLISLHIEVLDNAPVSVLHDLSEEVEENVQKVFPGDTVVHLDPVNRDHPRYDEICGVIREAVGQDERITGFHDLRIIGYGRHTKAVFDISLNERVKESEINTITRDLRQRLRGVLGSVRLSITAEPIFKYSRRSSDKCRGKRHTLIK